eukprot:scaffold27140_cov120-Isochrysis_galbana.AAC.2
MKKSTRSWGRPTRAARRPAMATARRSVALVSGSPRSLLSSTSRHCSSMRPKPEDPHLSGAPGMRVPLVV